MARNRIGGIRLFRLLGVTVYLDWTWLLVAWLMVKYRMTGYQSPAWAVAEYLALFAIILVHEFGHSLACRSVGGSADTIVLWPLGGVAVVQPPQRAGAMLWSIAAGPLVNVVLAPVTLGAAFLVSGWPQGDVKNYILSLAYINTALLVFNLLPIYPLDGGQILRSLLWFMIGRGPSLMVASVVGIVGASALGLLAVLTWEWWLGLMALFTLHQAIRGFGQARLMQRMARIPRRVEFVCPDCGEAAPAGGHWRCERCGQPVDAFVTPLACPSCGAPSQGIPCLDCGRSHPFEAWAARGAGVYRQGQFTRYPPLQWPPVIDGAASPMPPSPPRNPPGAPFP